MTENWHINEYWNDADGNPTQWVHNFEPIYIDLIDGQYEVNYNFKCVYTDTNLESAMKFADKYYALD